MLKILNNKKIQNFVKQSQNKIKGFTLLELVVVIAIIAILAVITFPSFQSALRRSRDAKRLTEIQSIQTDLLIYSNNKHNAQFYPASNWDNSGTSRTDCQDSTTNKSKSSCALVSLYKSLGKNPPAGVQNGEYKYVGIKCTTSSDDKACQSFQLWANLEEKNSALDNDYDLNTTVLNTGLCLAGTGSSYGTCTGYIVNGGNEVCESKDSLTGSDCVFDVSPQ